MSKKKAELSKTSEHTPAEKESSLVTKSSIAEQTSSSQESLPNNDNSLQKKQADTVSDESSGVQPEISIGMVGHVDHGKTTLVRALSGKWTDTHSEEIKRGITIRLGYADFSIYKCTACIDYPWTLTNQCHKCKSPATFVRKVSIVDAPGHESLMATMLCGANIMDGALLLIAGNEDCPQPQTKEHVTALEIIGMKNLIVVQNKVDLVDEARAQKNQTQIQEFLANTPYAQAPIIPISGLHNMNLDVLLDAIQTIIPTPQRDTTKEPLFSIARSFDINKPGTTPERLTGGVLGGSLKQGQLSVGQEIEIVPGFMTEERNTKIWKPLKTTITGIMTGGSKTDTLLPGGTAALQTFLDPSIVKSDQLVGYMAGISGKLPKVWNTISFEPHLLERVVGAKDKLIVEPIKLGEYLMLNVNAAATVGMVKELGKKKITCELKRPVAADKGNRITISRSIGQRWRLIGWGLILEK